MFYAPQYVAMSQGFFADEGLDMELSNGGGADKVMTAVVSGGADIGLAGPESQHLYPRAGQGRSAGDLRPADQAGRLVPGGPQRRGLLTGTT